MKKHYLPKYSDIVKRIKQARLDAGFKQEYVADKLKKYQSYLSKIEHGDRKIDIIELVELANFYGKDINFFLTPVEKKAKKK